MRSVDSPISMPARCQSDCSTDCVIILRPGGVIISMKASQRHDGRVHLASRPLRPQLEACTGVPSERGRARGSSFATQPLQTPPHQPLGPRPPCRLSSIHPPPPGFLTTLRTTDTDTLELGSQQRLLLYLLSSTTPSIATRVSRFSVLPSRRLSLTAPTLDSGAPRPDRTSTP